MKDLILHSEQLTVHVNAFGAELKGLEKDGIEYLYDGDPAYYGRTAPTLFPITGRFLSDTYYDGDQAYTMTLNGFAMNRNFEVTDRDDHSVTFTLVSDERTLACYPYPFRLDITYTAEGNRLAVRYRVENTGDRPMPWAVGAHTAYRWPLLPGEKPEDYRLLFEKEEDLTSFNPFNWKCPHFIQGRERPLSHDLFANFTRSMTDIRSEWIEFSNPANGHAVRIHRSEMPYLAMWTLPDENARLLCLEPNISVHAGAATTMADRQGCRVLAPGKTDETGFALEVR